MKTKNNNLLLKKTLNRLKNKIYKFIKPLRPYANNYSYQNEFIKKLPADGIILDISSGHNPFPYATILSDRYLEMTCHRREEIVLDHRPFLILDIHNLPFKDKSIDYIYCSHVLEHVHDPIKACIEIMRVGKSGYIETPTFMKDALFSWAKEMNHLWYIVQFNNHLIFFEYDKEKQLGVKSRYWENSILDDFYLPLQDLFYPNQNIFNSILEWESSFNVSIYRLGKNRPEHFYTNK